LVTDTLAELSRVVEALDTALERWAELEG